MNETEEVVDEFFGGDPRADALRKMRQALTDRLHAVQAERREETDDARAKQLDAQIKTMRRQVHTLATEEVVARFVEDSVRVTLAKSAPSDEE